MHYEITTPTHNISKPNINNARVVSAGLHLLNPKVAYDLLCSKKCEVTLNRHKFSSIYLNHFVFDDIKRGALKFHIPSD